MARLGSGKSNGTAFSPDGRILIVAGTLGVFAYDAETLAPEWSFLTPMEWAYAPAFSPDGRRLVFHADLGSVVILDSQTGGQIAAWGVPEETPSDVIPAPLEALAFSPDGTLLAGISMDGTYLWDPANGRLLQSLTPRGAGSPCGLAFSPDGKVLAGARGDVMTLWSMPDGRVIKTLSTEASRMMASGVEYSLADVEFLPDGQTLLTNDGSLWNRQTGEVLRVLEDFAGAQLSVSADGRIAAGDAGLWDVATGNRLWSYPADRIDQVYHTVFSPRGDLLAATSDSGVTLLDAASGQYRESLDAFRELADTAFSSDGEWILGWNAHGRFRVWDAESLWLRESFSSDPCKPGCTRVVSPSGNEYELSHPVNHDEVRSPDGQWVITFGEGYYADILLSEAGTGGRPVAALPAATGAAFSPDGRILATSHFNYGILLWDVAGLLSGGSPRPLASPTPGPSKPTAHVPTPTSFPLPTREFTPDAGAVYGLAYTPDSSRLTVVAADGVFLEQSGGLQEKWRWEYPLIDGSVAVSANGGLVAVRSELWDVDGAQLIRTMSISGSEAFMSAPAFSPDGQLLAAATNWGIVVWNTATGVLLHRKDWDPLIIVDDLAFSPDGGQLAIGAGTRLYFWNLDQDSLRGPNSTNCRGDFTFDQAFSPDGGMLLFACGTIDYPLGFLSFWDLSLQRLDDYWDEITSIHRLAVSPDGKWMAMGAYDGRIFLSGSGIDVELPGHGEPRNWDPFGPNGEVLGSEREVTALAFSPDGRTLASGSLDGSLLLTDLTALIAAAGAGDSKYASDTAPSGCALEPGYTVHARANARLWSLADVASGHIIREPSVGTVLYVLGGPEEGWIRADQSAKGWFWEVSLDADGANPGWIWQTRIVECPEEY